MFHFSSVTHHDIAHWFMESHFVASSLAIIRFLDLWCVPFTLEVGSWKLGMTMTSVDCVSVQVGILTLARLDIISHHLQYQFITWYFVHTYKHRGNVSTGRSWTEVFV